MDGVEHPEGGYRAKLARLIADAHAAHAELLERVPAGVRASLPVDATGITQAIDHLGEAAGLEEMHKRQIRAHKTNAAVMHARVFGFQQLSPETVQAAFVEGANARVPVLTGLAEAVGGEALGQQVAELLATHPPEIELEAAYAAQEHAAVLIAMHLDDSAR